MELQQLFGLSELRNADLVNDIIDEDNTVDLQMVLQLPEQVEEEELDQWSFKTPSSCSAEALKVIPPHECRVPCPGNVSIH